MTVHYQRGQGGKLWPKYECSRVKADYGGGFCQARKKTRSEAVSRLDRRSFLTVCRAMLKT
ncbi:hypothetical protein ACH4TV_33005 [Streptomyces sp. NPDC020898]|uniref:hypothetical protein n=1 Tax=Streptomyces sp. NPDC020898 TaxID=3365101 RepID=UPI0037AE160D